MLAMLSGALALMRYIQVRRKNRIDHFYERLLVIRTSSRQGMDSAAMGEALQRVAQHRFVEQLLGAGRYLGVTLEPRNARDGLKSAPTAQSVADS